MNIFLVQYGHQASDFNGHGYVFEELFFSIEFYENKQKIKLVIIIIENNEISEDD